MTRTFIQTQEFVRNWEQLSLEDQDLRRLELEILKNPKIGKVIRGTGGLRKLRFSFKNEGKSSSTRVCYVDFTEKKTVYLITIYSKSAKDSLTRAECKNISKMIRMLEHSI